MFSFLNKFLIKFIFHPLLILYEFHVIKQNQSSKIYVRIGQLFFGSACGNSVRVMRDKMLKIIKLMLG